MTARIFFAAALSLSLLACASRPVDRWRSDPLTLTIENHSPVDVRVFLVRAGVIMYSIGGVMSEERRQVTLGPTVTPRGVVYLEARTVTGERFVSDPIDTAVGLHVTWTLGSRP